MGKLTRWSQRNALALLRWAVLKLYRKAVRHRHKLSPAVPIALLAGLQSVPFPAWSVLVPFSTVLLTKRLADRREETVYGLSVGTASLLWSVLAFRSVLPVWSVVPFGALAAVPWWWHRRVRLGLLGRFAAVRSALAEDGLSVRAQRLTHSEYGWTRVMKHPGHTSEELRKHVPMLESRLGVVRGTLAVEDCARASHSRLSVTTKPLPRSIPVPARLQRSVYDPVPIGMSRTMGRVRTLTLAGKHGIVAGESGSGKSTMARTLIRAALGMEDLDTLLIDCKAGAEANLWVEITGHNNIAETAERAEVFIDYAIARLKEHGAIMRGERMGATFKASRRRKALLLVIDEGSDLIDAGLGDRLIWLVEKGRAMGVWIIYMTQHPTDKTLPVRIRKNVMWTIGMSVKDTAASAQIFGQGARKQGWDASLLPAGGGWFQIKDGEREIEQFKGWHIEDEQIPELCDGLFSRGPIMVPSEAVDASPVALKWIKDDRTVAEIADAEGVSKRTVQRWRAQARRAVRQWSETKEAK